MFLVPFYSVRFFRSHILFCMTSFSQLLHVEQKLFLDQCFLLGLWFAFGQLTIHLAIDEISLWKWQFIAGWGAQVQSCFKGHPQTNSRVEQATGLLIDMKYGQTFPYHTVPSIELSELLKLKENHNNIGSSCLCSCTAPWHWVFSSSGWTVVPTKVPLSPSLHTLVALKRRIHAVEGWTTNVFIDLGLQFESEGIK